MNDETFLKIADFVHVETEENFERLEFTQFDYIVVDPPTWAIVLAYIFTLIVCVIISVIVVRNEHNNVDNYYKYRNKRRYNRW